MIKNTAALVAALLIGVLPLSVSAQSISDLQAQLRALIAQIAQLQTTQPVSPTPVSVQPDDYGTGTTQSGMYCPKLRSTLQRGARDVTTGGQVSELQSFLTDYYNLDEGVISGGYFGATTHRHVVHFQTEQGLPALGIVGSMTRATIAKVCGNVTSPTSFSASPTSGSGPLLVTFKAPTTGGPYSVDFGNGIFAHFPYNTESPGSFHNTMGYSYESPGTYTASLMKFVPSGTEYARVVIGTLAIKVTDSSGSGSLTLSSASKTFASILNVSREKAQTICNALLGIVQCSWNGTRLQNQGLVDGSPRISIHSPAINETIIISNSNSFSFTDPSSSTGGKVDYRIFYVKYDTDSSIGNVYEVSFKMFGQDGTSVNGNVDLTGLPSGNYYPYIANVASGLSGGVGAYVYLKAPASGNSITVTAPNGGEQWEPGTVNTITWKPYGYNPSVNPASDVTAYLMKKVGDQFSNRGEIVPIGLASIHWLGQVKNPSTGAAEVPDPGEYYIRVINNKTKGADMSDAPFTLLAKPVDFKVNGSDDSFTIYDNQPLNLSWTSTGMKECAIEGAVRASPNGPRLAVHFVSTGGTRNYYAYVHSGSDYYNHNIHFTCWTLDGSRTVSDNIFFNVQPSSNATIQVTSPNGGESIAVNDTTQVKIAWRMNNITTPISIALYKDDKWLSWIERDFGSDLSLDGTYSYVWAPNAKGPALPALVAGVNPGYKIYITGQKADGTGYVDDKSDASFSFVVNTGAPSCSISASTSSANFGQPIMLTWTSQNAASANLNPTYGAVPVNGSQQVSVGYVGNQTQTTTFSLIVKGSTGEATCSTNVFLSQPGTPPSSGYPDQTYGTTQRSTQVASALTAVEKLLKSLSALLKQ